MLYHSKRNLYARGTLSYLTHVPWVNAMIVFDVSLTIIIIFSFAFNMSQSNILMLYNSPHVLVGSDARNFFSCKKWHRCFSGEVILEEKKSQSALGSRSLTCTCPLISAVQLHLERSFFSLAFFAVILLYIPG